MKCYYHNDRDAIGVCRTCGRALCFECMESDKKSMYIYCKGNSRCKKYEQATRRILDKESHITTKILRFLLVATLIFIVAYGISIIMPPAPLPPIPTE